jgi:hypothetical protein
MAGAFDPEAGAAGYSPMSFIKIDVRREIKKLAQGKPTAISAGELARFVLGYLPKKTRADDFLEALFRLEDPRG